MCMALAAALPIAGSAGTAASQDVAGGQPFKSTFPIDDADPERSIPSPEEAAREPQQVGFLVMELSQRAERALQEGKPVKAARYFRAVGKAAPDRALPFRKACAAHKSAGELAKAVEMCRVASGLPDASLDDYVNLLDVAFAKPGKLTAAELRDIDRTIARLERELGKGGEHGRGHNVAILKCQLAAHLGEAERLSACIEELRGLNAPPAQLLPYAWSLALSQGDLEQAETLKNQAIEAGVPQEKVDVMVRDLALAREKAGGSVLAAAKRWWPGVALVVLALGALVVFQRRRRAASKP
jgi:tetratricopeptide (TPR) repeat protein